MKVKLTLNSSDNDATSITFAESKKVVPDSAIYLYVYFGEKVLLSDFIVNISNLLPSLKLSSSENELTVNILDLDAKFVEFIVNLKLLSMKIGKLLFDFEGEISKDKGVLNSFINRHDMSGFNINNFKSLIVGKKYSEALEFFYKQYQNLKKSFYVLYSDRYNLLDSYGYI